MVLLCSVGGAKPRSRDVIKPSQSGRKQEKLKTSMSAVCSLFFPIQIYLKALFHNKSNPAISAGREESNDGSRSPDFIQILPGRRELLQSPMYMHDESKVVNKAGLFSLHGLFLFLSTNVPYFFRHGPVQLPRVLD